MNPNQINPRSFATQAFRESLVQLEDILEVPEQELDQDLLQDAAADIEQYLEQIAEEQSDDHA